ncbi:MAG: GDP-mannose 4,6-dehydratase [Candidatus Chisholmbacteria bacterium RIFCSPHIGHO2_01_FULL_48_12]|uniref:GDP-mannose 4,6-dehydratase n=1 Tax=Candidatus Chisholmbacteria bacterium RIFCSPHIGHO2_01_FULL_48_12 TaxID=1797589 RepID=A0A1G1VKJ5_9BACT|nr:MAG: GDP-mannose 4,6-dehydratase [Candidatus Chisholmbacteria bacterium RIFCSPHIGHO2_01_FULL_48_12]
MKTALITGITGQDGSYLAELLLEKNYRVIGLVSQKYNIGWQNVEQIKDKLVIEDGDLLDRESLERVMKTYQPEEIYNLAGLTFVPASWDQPTLTLDINTLGVSRILEVIKNYSSQSRFYQASSAKILGEPQDPYSISKAAAHLLVKVWRHQFHLFACSGIMYNHESVRRGSEFVTRKITQSAAKIKLGLEKTLALGNLDAKQDWGYAPDYVEAMWLMLQQDQPDDFVIATGQLHSVRDICQMAFSHLRLNYQDFVTIDQALVRPAESNSPVGDASEAKKILGWQPKTSFKDMIISMVEHDLKELQHD